MARMTHSCSKLEQHLNSFSFAVVHEFPKNETGFQCKVVCLIKLDKFEDALTQINKNKDLIRYFIFKFTRE